jgi:sugar phosphate isomerase/epimerase
MVIHSPFTMWDHNNLDLLPDNRAGLVERVRATLADVIRRAEDTHCQLVIENIEDKDRADRLRLARARDSDKVCVSQDAGHAHYAQVSTGAPPVDYYADAAGVSLAHVHLQDSDGYADRHWRREKVTSAGQHCSGRRDG